MLPRIEIVFLADNYLGSYFSLVIKWVKNSTELLSTWYVSKPTFLVLSIGEPAKGTYPCSQLYSLTSNLGLPHTSEVQKQVTSHVKVSPRRVVPLYRSHHVDSIPCSVTPGSVSSLPFVSSLHCGYVMGFLGPFTKPSESGNGAGNNTWPLSSHAKMLASSSGVSCNARSHTCQVKSHKSVHTSALAFLLVYCLLLPLPHDLISICAGFHGQPPSDASLSAVCPVLIMVGRKKK